MSHTITDILQGMYDKAVEAVMEASGLPFDELANARTEKSIVARAVLIDHLVGIGMSEAMIVRISGMSQQRVNAIKNSLRYKLTGLAARLLKEEVARRMNASHN